MTLQTYRRRLKKLATAKEMETLPSVLIAAAECMPLAKTGGLADAVGTLSATLHKLGFDARLILPCHRTIKEKYGSRFQHLTDFYIDLGWRHQYVGIELLYLEKRPVYLIDNEYYFGRTIYEPDPFGIEQYAFFCRAVLESLLHIDFIPSVIHCNDWHTAAIPMLLRTQYAGTALENIRTVFTIHNIAYQGRCSMALLCDILKSACIFADRINTVSPSYAREICTAEYGCGLQDILRACGRKLTGIVNGIDLLSFDPAADPLLSAHYTSASPEGKRQCKAALCSELGLAYDRPLLAMVSRLTAQKGFELVLPALESILSRDLSFVLLGTGDPGYESFLRSAAERHPDRFCAILSYDEGLAHRIYAGADLFLMPSRFEPCGIAQMLAMRYGALPIVRETGGLRDTVLPYNQYTGQGTGFSFSRFDLADMLGALDRALSLYAKPAEFSALMRNAMDADLSFTASAFEYGKLYLDML